MDELEYEIYSLSLKNKDPFQTFFRTKRFELILNELREVSRRGDKILELGCGVGIGTLRMAKLGFDMTGSDINKRFVDYANSESRKPGGKTKFFVSDIRKNNSQFNNKFDVVIASEVLEHVDDYRMAVENIGRYLKPGGRVIITMPNFHGLAGITEFLWALKAKYDWVHEHKHDICAPKRIEFLLRNAGLKPMRTYTAFYLSHFVPFISKRLSTFLFEKEQKYIRNMGFGELLISVSTKS